MTNTLIQHCRRQIKRFTPSTETAATSLLIPKWAPTPFLTADKRTYVVKNLKANFKVHIVHTAWWSKFQDRRILTLEMLHTYRGQISVSENRNFLNILLYAVFQRNRILWLSRKGNLNHPDNHMQ